MKVAALVVTYNRLPLLQECLAALRAQTRRPQEIWVIDNSSTDGTGEWLAAQPDVITVTQPNRGGAWGFYEGVKRTYQAGADFIWIMDDDTIPHADALEKLLEAVDITRRAGDRFGFWASKVVWTNGDWHLMNKQLLSTRFEGQKDLAYYAAYGIHPVEYSSFVSLLVSREAVQNVGLPVKEFFIWNDDIEYTFRIIGAGFAGALATHSVVLHKTPVNHESNIFRDAPSNLWKYAHGLRNELYTRRHRKGYGSYLRNVVKRFTVLPVKILLKRKDHRWAFIKMVWKSTWEALFFNPTKEKAD